MDQKISKLAQEYRPLAVEILKEAIRIPADYVDKPPEEGGDPECGSAMERGATLDIEYANATCPHARQIPHRGLK